MFHALQALVGPAVVERLVLLANHVLAAEPAATARLAPHAGRCIRLQLRDWPSLLPPPPSLAMRVTPAGLFEWCGAEAPAAVDLEVAIDASNPALLALRGLAGERPAVQVQGDAQLAADVNWLAGNLRWDLEDDLDALVGPAAAHELARLGTALAAGLRAALQAGSSLVQRWRPGADGTPG